MNSPAKQDHPQVLESATGGFKFRLVHKAILLVAVPFLFEIAIVLILMGLVQRYQNEALAESYSKEVISRLESIKKDFSDVESKLYLYSKTKNGSAENIFFSKQMDQKLAELSTDLSELRTRVKGHASEAAMVAQIEPLIADEFALISEAKSAIHNDASSLAFDDREQLKDEVSEYSQQLADAVHKLILPAKENQAKQSELRNSTSNMLLAAEYSALAINGLLGVALALLLTRTMVKRLELIVNNSRRFAQGLALNPPMKGQDEIAFLDQTFHEMVDDVAEANRKERAVVENAVDVICTLDARDRFLKINPAATKVWGYQTSDLIGQPITRLLHQDDLKTTLEAINHVKQGSGSTSFENRVATSEGRVIDNLWAIHWSESEQTMFCVVHDISDRKEVERLKQEFLAMVSHDLRTPLTSIGCILSLLREGMLGELSSDASEAVTEAETESKRLIKLVNDLLDMEKMEAGKIDIAPRLVPLKVVLSQSVNAVRALSEKNQVPIVIAETLLTVYADDDRLIQVIVNLLSNAIKFSPQGGKIFIAVHDLPDCVELQVIDQGRGVPAHLRETIFEKFKQVERDDARKKGGTGLGLPICKTIIEAHGGSIGVRSEEGKGSTFWFRLPKVKQGSKPAAVGASW